jgi:NAD(P)-dependent dehydrogenase (short-subunit alcohol dehydrogenase family)
MKTALITGANKGIGLEAARQLAALDFRVWLTGRNLAATRAAADALRAEGHSVEALRLDVADLESIRTAFAELEGQIETLNVLVNNAGILFRQTEDVLTVPPEIVQHTFTINALGTFFVTQAALPLLRRGSRVINVSSGAGQISSGMGTYSPVYSISKTAMNAITCQFAHALESRGVAVNAMSPGWVRTDMGGPSASRSVEQGAETITWLATAAPLDTTGQFFRDREIIPW